MHMRRLQTHAGLAAVRAQKDAMGSMRLPAAVSQQRLMTSDPYPDSLSRLLNPVGYIKWRMDVIDHARIAYEQCSSQFHKQTALVNDLAMQNNFQAWFNMTALHVWMLSARLRSEGSAGKGLTQEIFNHVWLDAELKLHEAGVKKNISKIIEGLLDSYYGQSLAYDEGLYRGDAILAAALWRNLLVSRDVSALQLVQAVEYTRRQLVQLDQLSLDEILKGNIKFT